MDKYNLLKIYNYSNNKKLYRKIYYEINKEKILKYNNERYRNRLNKLDNLKINKQIYIISFD